MLSYLSLNHHSSSLSHQKMMFPEKKKKAAHVSHQSKNCLSSFTFTQLSYMDMQKCYIYINQNLSHRKIKRCILKGQDLRKLIFTVSSGAFFFFFFLWPHPRHMEVPRLGAKSELQLPAQATETAMWDLSHVCNLHHNSQQPQILNPLSEAKD